MALTDTQLKTLKRKPLPSTGNRVCLAMEALDVTQAEVGAAIGVTQAYVSAVATGRHGTITVENAWKFAGYFGCLIEDLFPQRHAEVA